MLNLMAVLSKEELKEEFWDAGERQNQWYL